MGEHWYTRTGEPRYDANKKDARRLGLYPSVTTVAKMIRNYGLDKWIKQQQYLAAETVKRLEGEDNADWFVRCDEEAEKVSSEAAVRGSLFHDTIEAHLHEMKKAQSVKTEYVWPDDIRPWQHHFETYADQHIASLWDVERCLASDRLGAAGKCDLIYSDRDLGFAISDWKSQNVKKRPSFYDSWVWQLAAYRMMVGEISGENGLPQCVSVVINANEPSPFVRKVWSDEMVLWGERVITTIFELWRLVEKFDPRPA